MSYNRTILMGNLTRDPELRATQSGMSIADFTIAINETTTNKNGDKKTSATFIDCTAFGRTAENIDKYFSKGKQIFIEGRLRQETWEDKEGKKQSKLKNIVERLFFTNGGERSESKQNGANSGVSTPEGVNTSDLEDDTPF